MFAPLGINPRFLRDEAGNASRGPVFVAGASNNIAISNGRTIALCGVQDLVVVLAMIVLSAIGIGSADAAHGGGSVLTVLVSGTPRTSLQRQ